MNKEWVKIHSYDNDLYAPRKNNFPCIVTDGINVLYINHRTPGYALSNIVSKEDITHYISVPPIP